MKRFLTILVVVATVLLTSSVANAGAFSVNYGDLYGAQIASGRLVPPASPRSGATYEYMPDNYYGPGKGRLASISYQRMGSEKSVWTFTYRGSSDLLVSAANTYSSRYKTCSTSVTFTEKGEIATYDYSLNYYQYQQSTIHDTYNYEYDSRGRMTKAVCVSVHKAAGLFGNEDYERTTVRTFDRRGNLRSESIKTKQYLEARGTRTLLSETESNDGYIWGRRILNTTIYKEYDLATGALIKHTSTLTLYGRDGTAMRIMERDLMPKGSGEHSASRPNYTFTGSMAVQPKTQGLIRR